MRLGLQWPVSMRKRAWHTDSSMSEENEIVLRSLAGQGGDLIFSGVEQIQHTALAQDRSINIGGSANHARLFDVADGNAIRLPAEVLLTNKQTVDARNRRGRGD